MSFDWSEYLYLSQEALGIPSKSYSEAAKLRNILSRAYYSAFCNVRNCLRENTPYVPSSRQDTHRDIINQFLYSSDSNRIWIGRNLRRLFELRLKADYEDNFPELSVALARTALNLAEQIISRVSRLK